MNKNKCLVGHFCTYTKEYDFILNLCSSVASGDVELCESSSWISRSVRVLLYRYCTLLLCAGEFSCHVYKRLFCLRAKYQFKP
jgi:hypothetical protein